MFVAPPDCPEVGSQKVNENIAGITLGMQPRTFEYAKALEEDNLSSEENSNYKLFLKRTQCAFFG